MATRNEMLVKYVHSLVNRLRAQPRITLVAGHPEQTVPVVVFSGEALDVVADKLAALSEMEKKPGQVKRKR